MKKIIITGASGLIGNSLLDFFSGENHDLIALYNSNKPIIASNEKIKLCHIDIVNEDLTQFNHSNGFDFILCVDVMEHILEDVEVFKNFLICKDS